MCGIIGIVSKNNNVVPNLLNCLHCLEYRGYDSAGIATVHDEKINCVKCAGKIKDLEKKLEFSPIQGDTGIGHTRWATHGAVTSTNAHPHFTENVAIVHNGIIENYAELKCELQNFGYVFNTETDTEVVLFLIDKFFSELKSPIEAVKSAIKKIKGAFALGIIFKNSPHFLIGVKMGAPLVVGVNEDSSEISIASDISSISKIASKFVYLKDGEIVIIKENDFSITDIFGSQKKIEYVDVSKESYVISKGNYEHFMLKEIVEQKDVIKKTSNEYAKISDAIVQNDLQKFRKFIIIACGTSYYAGIVAKYWFESMTDVDADVYMASEFCYLNKKISNDTCVIFISQSGETADTLTCLKIIKEQKIKTIGIVNVKNSSIANNVDFCMYTYAGVEVGVASTKAFTTQLVVLLNFILSIGVLRNSIDEAFKNHILDELSKIGEKIQLIFDASCELREIAKYLIRFQNAIYLARNNLYPIALEAALKLKEISYIHAEGYPAGELKHGPLALIDDNLPVIVLCNSKSHVFFKTISNLENVLSRNGNIVLFSDSTEQIEQSSRMQIFKMPEIIDELSPILYVIPMQLIAYYAADLKSNDIDQPRNLAKSVTVE